MITGIAKWFQGSLVRAILGAMLIPSILSIALISILFTRQSTNALTHQMEQNLQQLVAARAGEINLRILSGNTANTSTGELDQVKQVALSISVLDGAGYGFLLDQNGSVVAHPAMDVLGRDVSVATLLRAENGSADDLRKRLRHMIDGNVGQGYYEDTKGKSLLVYAPVPAAEWNLGITVPQADVIQSSIEMRRRVLIITGVLICFASGLSYFLANMVHRPLLQLLQGVKQLSLGSQADPINITSFHEIEGLAIAFNEMAAKVYEREARFKARVARLKIEIDTQKRQKQVDAIVETDFFKRLELNASKLRAQIHED